MDFRTQLENALEANKAVSVSWMNRPRENFWNNNTDCFLTDNFGMVIGVKTPSEIAMKLWQRCDRPVHILLWLHTLNPDCLHIDETRVSKKCEQTRQVLYYNIYINKRGK